MSILCLKPIVRANLLRGGSDPQLHPPPPPPPQSPLQACSGLWWCEVTTIMLLSSYHSHHPLLRTKLFKIQASLHLGHTKLFRLVSGTYPPKVDVREAGFQVSIKGQCMERHRIGIRSSSFLTRRIERRSLKLTVVLRSQTLYPKSMGKGSGYARPTPLRGQCLILHFLKN